MKNHLHQDSASQAVGFLFTDSGPLLDLPTFLHHQSPPSTLWQLFDWTDFRLEIDKNHSQVLNQHFIQCQYPAADHFNPLDFIQHLNRWAGLETTNLCDIRHTDCNDFYICLLKNTSIERLAAANMY